MQLNISVADATTERKAALAKENFASQTLRKCEGGIATAREELDGQIAEIKALKKMKASG
jgi:hypothetical protein